MERRAHPLEHRFSEADNSFSQKNSMSARNIQADNPRNSGTAPELKSFSRKQAIAKALNLSSRNGPSHTNQFDFWVLTTRLG